VRTGESSAHGVSGLIGRSGIDVDEAEDGLGDIDAGNWILLASDAPKESLLAKKFIFFLSSSVVKLILPSILFLTQPCILQLQCC
jgi:hypothetical protein